MSDGLEWFARDGARLPWVRMGQVDGPVVLALPGLSDGLMPLSEVGPHVIGSTRRARRLPFRVVTLSHRHPVAPGTSTRDLAEDAAAFVDEVLGGPVVVVGHSMGGMVAQWLAALRPDLVDHLVLTASLARPVPTFVEVLERWRTMVAGHRWREFAEAANEAAYTGSELLRRRLLLRLTRPPSAPHLVGRHDALTDACLHHDSTGVLDGVSSPTLVLAGAEDRVVPPATSRDLADRIDGAAYEELPGLAHGFPEQAPGRTLAAVTARLAHDHEERT